MKSPGVVAFVMTGTEYVEEATAIVQVVSAGQQVTASPRDLAERPAADHPE